MTFRKYATADNRFKKHMRMLQTGVYSLDVESFREELESMHSIRKVRNINLANAKSAQAELVAAAEQNCAFRSRAVEIIMQIHRVCSQLELIQEALTDYLSTKYSPYLMSEYNTKGERTQAIKTLLHPFEKKYRESVSVKEIADLLVADIDAASWTLQRLVSILELNITGERRL